MTGSANYADESTTPQPRVQSKGASRFNQAREEKLSQRAQRDRKAYREDWLLTRAEAIYGPSRDRDAIEASRAVSSSASLDAADNFEKCATLCVLMRRYIGSIIEAFLAEISGRSPRTFFICTIKKYVDRIKVFKKINFAKCFTGIYHPKIS